MTPAEKKFLKIVTEEHYFDQHHKVLIALSGGQDSMTLFNWLYAFRDTLGITLGIAHINHGLRAESIKEERAIRELGNDKQVPVYVDKFTGEFTEKKAREFRYHFFEKIMSTDGYTALVTAHHRGDIVETVLMRQISGRGLRSLQGIEPRQPFGLGELIRPLLRFEKKELDAPVFFEDATNKGTDYLRNRIRNQLIPGLTQENPQFSEAILSMTDEIRMSFSIIHDKIDELDILKDKISLSKFLAQTDALQHFILQEYFTQYPSIQINKKQFQLLLHIIRRPQQYKGELNKSFEFIKTKTVFYLRPKLQAQLEDLLVLSENPKDSSFMEVALPIEGEIEIRKRRPGDVILINGHHKKLRKFFIEYQVPLEKREMPLIFVDKMLYAIVDVACSDLSKAAKNDKIKRILWVKPSVREETHHARKKS